MDHGGSVLHYCRSSIQNIRICSGRFLTPLRAVRNDNRCGVEREGRGNWARSAQFPLPSTKRRNFVIPNASEGSPFEKQLSLVQPEQQYNRTKPPLTIEALFMDLQVSKILSIFITQKVKCPSA